MAEVGFHRMRTLPTSRHHRAALFFIQQATPPSPPHHLYKQNTCVRATRILPPSQEAITSIKWEGSTERLKTVRQTAGARQQFPRVETSKKDGKQHQRGSATTKGGAHRLERERGRGRESIATAIAMQGCDDPSGIGTPCLLAARALSGDSASEYERTTRLSNK